MACTCSPQHTSGKVAHLLATSEPTTARTRVCRDHEANGLVEHVYLVRLQVLGKKVRRGGGGEGKTWEGSMVRRWHGSRAVRNFRCL